MFIELITPVNFHCGVIWSNIYLINFIPAESTFIGIFGQVQSLCHSFICQESLYLQCYQMRMISMSAIFESNIINKF